MERTPLSQHLESMSSPHTGEDDLGPVINAMAAIGKELSRLVASAALASEGQHRTGCERERSDTQAAPDSASTLSADRHDAMTTRAHEVVRFHLTATGRVAKLVSAVRSRPEQISEGEHARFVAYVDPLHGMIPASGSGDPGSIFGVYRRDANAESDRSMLRGGAEQVAAGYLLYGVDTVLVFTTGAGVHGYLLDHTSDQFVCTHDRIRCPDRGSVLAANMSRAIEWPHEIREFVEHVSRRSPHRLGYSLRYCGAMVANVHHSLLHGGLALFPPDRDHENGSLQLLSDCAPLAMIAEQAGGKASTGHDRILDQRAFSLHERSPLVIGSAGDVDLYERFLCGRVRALDD